MAGKDISGFLVRILLVVVLLTSVLAASVAPAGAQGSEPGESATIWGYVYDSEDHRFLSNMTIMVERENYLGNSTVTDGNGSYRMDLPEGEYILRIQDEERFIIHRHEFNVSYGQVKRLDFSFDSDNRKQSTVSGTIRNKYTMSPMVGVEVRLFRLNPIYPEVWPEKKTTGTTGHFSFKVPAGNYELRVFSDGKRIHNETFALNFSEDRGMDLVLEQPSNAITIENALGLLKREFLNIIFIIIIIVIGLVLLSYIDRVFRMAVERIRKKPRKYIDEPIIDFGERVAKWNIIILMLIAMAYLTAQVFDVISIVWIPVKDSIASIYIILLLVVFMRISLMVWSKAIHYMRGDHATHKPMKLLSHRMVTLVEIVGKYSIATIFGLSILLTGLAAVGMSDQIINGFTDGLATNYSVILFIVTIFVIAYISMKFLSSFFEDMKGRSTRFRPEMIAIASKGSKVFIYAIIAMILSFTILSAVGLGEIGQTMILVFSMIIGLVVSMAATGSIGNMLSGLVIMSFKPFDEGDWVVIAKEHQGKVVEMNLMFTKVRDLEDEIIEIPNNLILTMGIVNWTMSAKKGGFAVEVDVTIGYDVPAEEVIDLMKASCEGIEGVLESRDPTVVTTTFENHAIGYKLRAYIDDPVGRNRIRTDIMVNMQKVFTEAGVEILSPIYEVGRCDTIPTRDDVKARMKDFKKSAR